MPICMSTSIICDRAFDFSLNILTVTERLAERGFGARHIAFQLVRCGTSIGANAEEAQEGQTKKDFIAKMAIARKEARETVYWLRLAIVRAAAMCDELKSALK